MAIAGWLVLGPVGAAALAQEAQPVVSVEVRGTQSVAEGTCLAQIQLRPGMPYQDSIVNEDIRRLYALGYFTDVRVETEPRPEGLHVVFLVEEKPTIAAIEWEGAQHLRTKRLEELLDVNVGQLYDARKLKMGLDQIKAEYRRKGFANVAIADSASIDEAANTATVYLVIDEGPRMRIKDILIEGNQAFSDHRLRKVLKTKPKGWFRSGVYNEQVLEEDLERVRAFYRQDGYQDVAADAQVLAGPSGDWLYVHLTVEEGLQHRVGAVELTGHTLFSEHELKSLLTLNPGAVYSTEALQENLRMLKQHYGDVGYINASIVPETHLDDQTKRVDITLHIVEHELTYVSRVEVRGNRRTQDKVIRRELRIYPGDPFDGASIRRSIERLYNLGFFEEVSVDTEPTEQSNYEDLIVEVKEAKTGSFSFGGGFSSVDKLVGLVELEQRNFDLFNYPTFVGAGQDLRFGVEIGSVRRYFDLSFTEPWIFGYPLSFGVDAYNRTRLRSTDLGLAYEEERRGGGVRFGKDLTDTVRLNWDYQLFRVEISDIVEDASADLKAEEGTNDVSVLGTVLSWDRRDNRFDPTRGFFLFSSADLAGGVLAGDKDFYRVQAGASAYLPHAERFVLETRMRAGLVNEYDDTAEVPIFERFFGGGANTVRGFDERQVGPVDPFSNDPIGGETILVGTVEEVFTLLQDERGKSILKTSVFFDVGNVWQKVGDFGDSFEAGAGIGFRVNTPIGPLRLDLGFPVTQLREEDREPQVHFNISRSF